MLGKVPEESAAHVGYNGVSLKGLKPLIPFLKLSVSPPGAWGTSEGTSRLFELSLRKVKGGANSPWSILRWPEAILFVIRTLALNRNSEEELV